MPLSQPPDLHEVAAAVRAAAIDEGFSACGFAPAVDSQGFTELVEWIEAGYAAEMGYFANRLDAYRHPAGVLPGARAVIVLAFPYPAANPASNEELPDGGVHGRVARYSWSGLDYHDVIHPKLKRICKLIRGLRPESHARGIVDTAPLMEREVAQLAGLGWRGKNTLLLNPVMGSYFFLACVLVDIELPADTPFEPDHCGTCTACLDACPTNAFVGPHVLDASKCISFLTIESRELIPEPMRAGIGDWVFGCDVCQEVCPWNRKPTRRAMAAEGMRDARQMAPTQTVRGRMELLRLFSLDDESFRKQFRDTAMWRTRRRGLLRNAAVVLGNVGDVDCVETLMIGLRDSESIVRAACLWAIQKLLVHADSNEARTIQEALARFRLQETDPIVLAEFD
ncbi:tRNA epoxyqueuosine(34) reductase QueG [Allorhodopirellula heiligendammensis]|uniref:Epoxyqueuosine reductase n=1 Tax=Allorhodopirellula heiligendammensis TaxID=2714739 RepID=A0A5C6BI98_9BACT|nr:tRNA epoxyqueuosine(34) reductase QueG [Allorhodopirellula heiligendammensis]TWU10174.1 Epoxyqueuosine reductase [Allorhodopirellula heiligendammensis]